MSETMRGAIFLGDGKVEVREFPKPVASGTEVVVKLKIAGLCGSDMHPYHQPAEYWSQHPIIRGHEPSGIVESVGELVTFVKPGDRVSVDHAPFCGHCPECARGELLNCSTIGPGKRLASMTVHGCDADYVLADQNMCFQLPDELSFEDGSTIACAGGTSFHALRRADVRAGEYVLVSGLGPVGLAATLLASTMGGIVIGSEPIAYRRELALQNGATYAIDPTSEDMPEKVKEITGGGAEVVIETSGNDRARVDVIKATPYRARLVYVGWGGRENNAIVGPMLGERWITGSNLFTDADYYDVTQLMLRENIRFSSLVTHRFPLEEAQEAFDLFDTKETGKVVFAWD